MSKMGAPRSDTDPDTVTIIHRRGPAQKVLKSSAELNEAQRRGAVIETTRNKTAGANKQHQAPLDAARLDETEDLHHERVSLNLRMVLQRSRQAKEWSQKDLATHVNEKPQVIAEYESGKAVPNQQILGKMERVLGVKLRGKDMGQPLVPIAAKKK